MTPEEKAEMRVAACFAELVVDKETILSVLDEIDAKDAEIARLREAFKAFEDEVICPPSIRKKALEVFK